MAISSKLAALLILLLLVAANARDATASRHRNNNNDAAWMNDGGPGYEIANAPGFATDWILTDPSVRHFDVYSKTIRSRYSQVHWTNHGPMDLPPDVVERYNHSSSTAATTTANTTNTIAIVGYEVDQVGIHSETGEEWSVPITWAYNHHYMVFLLGETETHKATGMARVPLTPDLATTGMGHGGAHTWLPTTIRKPGAAKHQDDQKEPSLSNSKQPYMFLSEGNGGEMRKSYHSYPRGYAQLLQKPHAFSVTPMQIDTWNRDTMPNAKFVPPPPGEVSRYFPASTSRRIVNNLEAANYNPLLECPCTDRLPKAWGMTYKLVPSSDQELSHQDKDESEGLLENATECFGAAETLLPSTVAHHRHIEGTGPGLCRTVKDADGNLTTTWDRSRQHHHASTIQADADALVGSTSDAIVPSVVVLNTTSEMAEITLKGPLLEEGATTDSRWFSIGLGADSMCLHMDADECTTGGPYAIVVMPGADGGATKVVERKLDYHGPGRVLEPTQHDSEYRLEVVSNNIVCVDNDKTRKKHCRRVVRLRRPLEGPTDDHYSFEPDKLGGGAQNEKLPIILATGCPHGNFGRHCGHESPDPLAFAKVGVPQEVLRDGIQGTIGGRPFRTNCLDEPYGDLVKQKNPTCAVQTYRGGLKCCVHDNFLLDANQTVPWNNDDRGVLEYRLKFRFYYQDYFAGGAATRTNHHEVAAAAAMAPNADAETERELDEGATSSAAVPSHRNLRRVYWQTEASSGEYDIPGCETPETNPSACVHTITSRWKVPEMLDFDYRTMPKEGGIELIYAAPHCHAPTCLSMELYNADTGGLICRVEPRKGRGDLPYDEAGFLAIPPCLWSSDSNSNDLPRPEFLAWNTTLLSIKRANNTYPHTGEMASWQMRAVVLEAPPPGDAATTTQTATEESARELDAVATSLSAATPSHRNLRRVYWMTEAGAGEYDVPGCNTPETPSECVHTITSRLQVSDMLDFDYRNQPKEGGIELIYAAPHCHAPTCLSIEMYNADTGRLLCKVEPRRGGGDEALPFDEAEFIAIPPCLWSSHAAGDDDLPEPEFLAWNTTLLSIKKANNTFPHTGEMALWQMRGVVLEAPPGKATAAHGFDPSPSAIDTEPRGLRRRPGA